MTRHIACDGVVHHRYGAPGLWGVNTVCRMTLWKDRATRDKWFQIYARRDGNGYGYHMFAEETLDGLSCIPCLTAPELLKR